MLPADHPQLGQILPMVVDTGQFLMQDEYLISQIDSSLSAKLVAWAAWEGYLPMGAGRSAPGLMLLKIHKNRTVMAPEGVHVGKKSRKAADKFRLSIDEAFPEVVKGIQEHTFTHEHADNWLTDDLVQAYVAVNQLPKSESRGVRFHSVELWDKATGRLVAGEVGYTVGGIYSSCTGFALKKEFPGAGTLQLAALGKWLQQRGFALWDLGMALDYKKELGGKEQPRRAWVACVRRLREMSVGLTSPEASSSTRELLAFGAHPEAREDAKEQKDADPAKTGIQLLNFALKPETCGALTPESSGQYAALSPTSRVVFQSLTPRSRTAHLKAAQTSLGMACKSDA